MFIDNENQLTSGGTAGQSIAFGTGTTALGNVIDSGPVGGQNTPNTNVGRDWGTGYPAWLYFLVVSGLTSGGAATVDLQLVSSAAAALTAPNIMLDLTGGAIAFNAAKLATGSAIRVAMPRAGIGGTTGWLRFIGLNVIVATAALTGGVVNCFLSRDIQDNLLYAAGYTVS